MYNFVVITAARGQDASQMQAHAVCTFTADLAAERIERLHPDRYVTEVRAIEQTPKYGYR